MKKFFMQAALCTSIIAFAPAAFAMTDAECEQAFVTADANKDGVLTEAEASAYFATHRVAQKPIADGKLTRDAFMTNCKANMYVMAKTDPGAPLDGANSFTENQAKDRVLSAGLVGVSALAKDDKGIWRGTAMRGADKVNVAVDYKGNVVTN